MTTSHLRNPALSTRLKNYLLRPFTDIDSKRSTHGDSLYVLDGVRGLAVLIVIASHTAAFTMYGQGSLGVLLFFFLSGFVLTLPYADNPRRFVDIGELYRFALGRILRIVPIYLVAVAWITWLLGADVEWFLANALFIKGWNHLWSVAEEARFYVLFPLVMLALALIPGWLARVAFLAVVTVVAKRYEYAHMIDMLDGRMVGFYFWMFLGGCLACLLYRWPLLRRWVSNRPAERVLGAVATGVIVLVFTTSNQMVDDLWRPLLPWLPEELELNGWRIPGTWFFLFLLLIYGVTTFPDSWAGRLLRSRFLRHIGLLSYSLYLFHMPIMLELRKFGFDDEGRFIVVFVITYAVAYVSYIVVEKPFLMLKPRRRSPAKPVATRA